MKKEKISFIGKKVLVVSTSGRSKEGTVVNHTLRYLVLRLKSQPSVVSDKGQEIILYMNNMNISYIRVFENVKSEETKAEG